MGKKAAAHQDQPTLWDISDEVWPMLQAMLEAHDPAKPTGHRRVDRRRGLKGMIFRLRPGCQGNQRSQQCGDDRTGPRHVQPWCQRGLFARLWAVLVEACDALGGVDGPWQAADAAMGNSRLGGDCGGRHPTDRGTKGGSGAGWWKPPAVPWAPCARGLRCTTRSGGPPPWRPAWWRVPSRLRSARSIAASTRALTSPQGMRLWGPSGTPRLVDASARTRWIPPASRRIRRAAGSWNARWRGSQKAGASASALSRTPSMSEVCGNGPVPCCGCDAGHDSSLIEIVS
jgi:transposase